MTSSLVLLMGWPGRGTYALHTAAKATSMLWREITSRPLAVVRGGAGSVAGVCVEELPSVTPSSSLPAFTAANCWLTKEKTERVKGRDND